MLTETQQHTLLKWTTLQGVWAYCFLPPLATLYQSRDRLFLESDPWFVPFASIPTLYFLAYLPHVLKLVPSMLIQVYNNKNPRSQDHTLQYPQQRHTFVYEFVQRCTSCHENTFEAIIGFAPAVMLCHMRKVQNVLLIRELCVRFLKLRILYLVLYLSGHWMWVSYLRTLVFNLSLGVLSHLYVLALVG